MTERKIVIKGIFAIEITEKNLADFYGMARNPAKRDIEDVAEHFLALNIENHLANDQNPLDLLTVEVERADK